MQSCHDVTQKKRTQFSQKNPYILLTDRIITIIVVVSFFSSLEMLKTVKTFVKSAANQVSTVGEQFVSSIADNDNNQEEATSQELLGALWELSEHVGSCRGCWQNFSMPIMRRKHHCRKCGGEY